jgi:hypothetical protein
VTAGRVDEDHRDADLLLRPTELRRAKRHHPLARARAGREDVDRERGDLLDGDFGRVTARARPSAQTQLDGPGGWVARKNPQHLDLERRVPRADVPKLKRARVGFTEGDEAQRELIDDVEGGPDAEAADRNREGALAEQTGEHAVARTWRGGRELEGKLEHTGVVAAARANGLLIRRDEQRKRSAAPHGEFTDQDRRRSRVPEGHQHALPLPDRDLEGLGRDLDRPRTRRRRGHLHFTLRTPEHHHREETQSAHPLTRTESAAARQLSGTWSRT